MPAPELLPPQNSTAHAAPIVEDEVEPKVQQILDTEPVNNGSPMYPDWTVRGDVIFCSNH